MQSHFSRLIDEFCKLFCGCDEDHIIVPFHLGRVVKQSEPITPNPQFTLPARLMEALMPQVDFDMADDDIIVLTIDPTKLKDKKGNPAQIDTTDGPPQWMTDNGDVVLLQPAADGMSCSVSAVGPFGDATIQFKADGRQGPDRKDMIGIAVAHVKIPGDVVDVTIGVGTPTKQP